MESSPLPPQTTYLLRPGAVGQQVGAVARKHVVQHVAHGGQDGHKPAQWEEHGRSLACIPIGQASCHAANIHCGTAAARTWSSHTPSRVLHCSAAMLLTCRPCPWWQASQSAQHSVIRAQQDGWREERGYSLVRAAKGGRLLNLRRKQEQHTQALHATAATQAWHATAPCCLPCHARCRLPHKHSTVQLRAVHPVHQQPTPCST